VSRFLVEYHDVQDAGVPRVMPHVKWEDVNIRRLRNMLLAVWLSTDDCVALERETQRLLRSSDAGLRHWGRSSRANGTPGSVMRGGPCVVRAGAVRQRSGSGG
jgi:hypothetical protein